MLALIDADIVAYRCAAVTKEEPENVAIFQTEEMIKRIIHETEADEFVSFLTGPDNFRYKINPEYKANRKDVEKPKHLQICREFILKYYNGVLCTGHEADDAMGIEQDKVGDGDGNYSTVICSIDKDMLMIPGLHYNFVKNEYTEISKLEGIKQLYRQMIIGDPTDNIFGVKGIGKVGAAKIIDHLCNEGDMYDTVMDLYDGDIDRFVMNANCLWIQRKPLEIFEERKDGPWFMKLEKEANEDLKNILETSKEDMT
jgi:DNA polymerase-1